MKIDQEEERGKLFVGGLSWETSQEKLKEYFSRYGEVIDCVVMKNKETGQSRGFGFITYKDPDCVSTVLSAGSHELDGRVIDPKVCSARSLQQKKKGGSFPKIFLGGLPTSCNETDIRAFFSKYGNVVEVVLMYDQERKKSKGFGFLSFEKEDSVKAVCAQRFVKINGKQVECKYAEPREKSNRAQPNAPQPNSWGQQNWGGPPGQAPATAGQANNGYPGYQANWGQQPSPYGPQGGWGALPPPQGYVPAYQGWGPGYGPAPAYGAGYGQGYGGYGPGYGGYGAGYGAPPAQGGPPAGPAGGPAPDPYAAGPPVPGQPAPPGGPIGQPGPGMGAYPQDGSNYGPAKSYNAGYAAPGYGAPADGNQAASRGAGQTTGYHPYRR